MIICFLISFTITMISTGLRPTHVAVTIVRSFVTVMVGPAVEIILQFRNGGIEFFSERLTEECIEDGTVESLYEAVHP